MAANICSYILADIGPGVVNSLQRDTKLQLFAKFPEIEHNHHAEFIEIIPGLDVGAGPL